MEDNDNWVAPWRCEWTKKQDFTFAPDFSGFNPDTGQPWSPKDVIKSLGMTKADNNEIEAVCQSVLNEHADKANQYRSGKTGMFGFFMGKVMEATQKRADPKVASETLKRLLGA